MKRIRLILSFGVSLLIAACIQASNETDTAEPKVKSCYFLAIESTKTKGLNRVQIHYVDQETPERDWTIELPSLCREIQVLDDNQLLVSQKKSGYIVYDLLTQEILKKVDGFTGVESARRMQDGRTILFCRQGGKTVLHELDPEDKPLRKAVFPDFSVGGELRSTDKGTFLLGAKLSEFAEVNLDGEILRRITIAGSKPCYMTLPLTDNHFLVSCGYGGFLAEVDEKGAIVKKIGGKDSAPKGVTPNFFGGFDLLENGDIVVANWNGHSKESWTKGAQLIEYDKSGNIVWTYHDIERIPGTLHGVQMLSKPLTNQAADK